MSQSSDPYSRFEYRKLFAWPDRIRREWPLLEKILRQGPSRRLLDLGCGSGEHSRFLHEQGFQVVGVDSSPSMIASCRQDPIPPGLDFVESDLRNLDATISGSFGGAICLGNTLPHLTTDDDLRRFANGLFARLEPGAKGLFQILNYDRILSAKERSLPINVRPDPVGDGEIVFVRLMSPADDGQVRFFPVTLRLRPGFDPPVELVHAREVPLRGWRMAELEQHFRAAGFVVVRRLGGFDESVFDPKSSRDSLLEIERP